LTHTAWQFTSPVAHAAMHDATDEVESAAELVLEAALVVVSLWAAARPKRATIGMKACML
jgi:hypothetical protein